MDKDQVRNIKVYKTDGATPQAPMPEWCVCHTYCAALCETVYPNNFNSQESH